VSANHLWHRTPILTIAGIQETLNMFVQSAKIQQHAQSLRQPALQHTHIPGLLSAKFVGRDDEITWLRDSLLSHEDTHTRRRLGLYGMTGIGKTQLVWKIELLKRSLRPNFETDAQVRGAIPV
jgi:hypothetical protein